MFFWSHNRSIWPNVAQSGEQTQTASWTTVTCLKIAGNKAVDRFHGRGTDSLSWLPLLYPPCLSPLTGLQRVWLINITECQLCPHQTTETHSVFMPRPELIAVVVWLLTRLMSTYLKGPLLSLTLPQQLLWQCPYPWLLSVARMTF